MDVSDFDFDLPAGAIAQRPVPRGTARMMTLDRQTGAIAHRHVSDLPELLLPGDLLVVNDTKVLPARIFGTDEKGRRTEFLLVEREETRAPGGEGEVWSCLAKPGRRLKTRGTFFFEGGWTGTPVHEPAPPATRAAIPSSPSKQGADAATSRAGLFAIRFVKPRSEANVSLLDDLPALGSAPLPPYIHRPGGVADERDLTDYQTVFAEHPGAIAAPTAGLHFTNEILREIEKRGAGIARVTLHVGIGTFKPVKTARVEEHVMDAERGTISPETAARVEAARSESRRIVAVGTTSVRTLEASARAHGGRVQAGPFETGLFLVPGAEFQVVDALLTNFHLPRSTLLMLVSAFAGRDHVRAAYQEAVASGYRFFSYGDAMFVS